MANLGQIVDLSEEMLPNAKIIYTSTDAEVVQFMATKLKQDLQKMRRLVVSLQESLPSSAVWTERHSTPLRASTLHSLSTTSSPFSSPSRSSKPPPPKTVTVIDLTECDSPEMERARMPSEQQQYSPPQKKQRLVANSVNPSNGRSSPVATKKQPADISSIAGYLLPPISTTNNNMPPSSQSHISLFNDQQTPTSSISSSSSSSTTSPLSPVAPPKHLTSFAGLHATPGSAITPPVVARPMPPLASLVSIPQTIKTLPPSLVAQTRSSTPPHIPVQFPPAPPPLPPHL